MPDDSAFILLFVFRCVPICNNCRNGECVANNTCNCNSGYSMDHETSQCNPVCQTGCVNGMCTNPNTCECLQGYKKIEENL